MIRLPDLRAALDAMGVRLDVELIVDAPGGVLTPDVVALIRQYRGALLVDLARERQWDGLKPLRWGGADDTPGVETEGGGRDLDLLREIVEGAEE